MLKLIEVYIRIYIKQMILWNNFVRKIKRFMETNIWNRGGNDKIKRRRKLEEKMSSYPVTRHNVSSVFIVYSNTKLKGT